MSETNVFKALKSKSGQALYRPGSNHYTSAAFNFRNVLPQLVSTCTAVSMLSGCVLVLFDCNLREVWALCMLQIRGIASA